ncbi:MAG: crossover junction endodeoxyribonuclease RuvC [Candidatus Taylorbacteria bacterium]|nr:crossover junction endodeoxyribonuclease RuvC [Candidatus Taylorbacteria bacterium]
MKILGIDPGYDRVGVAVIENNILLHSECFDTDAKDSFHIRLKSIGLRIKKIIEKYNPDVLAIESLFITKNQKTAMKVAEARGVISYEACLLDIPIYEYSPPQIKVAVTGHGGSDKAQIIKMIPLLVKMKSKKAQDDEYDAIAVALTCQAHIGSSYPHLK